MPGFIQFADHGPGQDNQIPAPCLTVIEGVADDALFYLEVADLVPGFPGLLLQFPDMTGLVVQAPAQ